MRITNTSKANVFVRLYQTMFASLITGVNE